MDALSWPDMTQPEWRDLMATIVGTGTAITIIVGLYIGIWKWVCARIKRDNAIASAVTAMPLIDRDLKELGRQFEAGEQKISARLERLEHEVRPNGDTTDEGRPLRAIVRFQGSQLITQTGLFEEMRKRLEEIEDELREHKE